MGGNVFAPQRRERITFPGKLGDAKLGHLKKGLGCSKIIYFKEKDTKMGEAKTCLDCTGASGSLFLRSYGNHRNPARTRIEAEGKAYVKH